MTSQSNVTSGFTIKRAIKATKDILVVMLAVIILGYGHNGIVELVAPSAFSQPWPTATLESCDDSIYECWRQSNIDHPCQLNFDQGRDAVH
ncbi:MAG: hypothetical protein U5N53_00615 [Mycobacterium sp.]|nr:hypothetical protein [Mycobacterium sp.]